MNPLIWLVLILHTLVCIALIVFILLHSGKGTGLSSMFGGVMPSASSGTSIIEKNLDRITVVLAGLFAFTSIVLMIFYRP